MTEPISLPDEGTEGRMWHELLDLADLRPDGWTLVGALMVSLHAAAANLTLARLTKDIDAVVEVRGFTHEPQSFAADLLELGWDIHDDDVSPDGTGHRFSKGSLKFDLLAPEGLGNRKLVTIPPLETVSIAGATQALRRSELVHVQCGDRTGAVPCPDALGAIVLKSCAACSVENDPDKSVLRHLDDLALLYATAADPVSMREESTKKDRNRIRGAPSPNWSVLSSDVRPDAETAYAIIAQ